MSQHITLHLTDDQRAHLERLIRAGSAPARVQTRARILLLSDRSQGQARTDRDVAAALLCSTSTIVTVRRQCVLEGLDAALYDKARPGAVPKITGDIEAQITLLACSEPPEGHARWSMRLLADKAVVLGYLERISHVAIWQRLKKTKSLPGG